MSRFTIDNVIKTRRQTMPFSDVQEDSPYSTEIKTLIDQLKTKSGIKQKIEYINYFLEKTESKLLNDLISFYLSWENLSDKEKQPFIDKIKNEEGLISFITRITKEEDYQCYKSFFYPYIAKYEEILFSESTDTPETGQQENKALNIKLGKVSQSQKGELKKQLQGLCKKYILNDNINNIISGKEKIIPKKEKFIFYIIKIWEEQGYIDGLIKDKSRNSWNIEFVKDIFTDPEGKELINTNISKNKTAAFSQNCNTIINELKEAMKLSA